MSQAARLVEEVSQALCVVPQFSEFETNLAEFKEVYVGRVYDLTDKKQEKQARSDKYKIGTIVSKLDQTHKALKAPIVEELNAKIGILDGERKRIKDELQGIQADIAVQIEKHEAEIAAAAEAIERKIIEIESLYDGAEDLGLLSVQITLRLNQCKQIVIDDSFGERKGEAAISKDLALSKLQVLLDATLFEEQKAKEAEAARLEAQRIEMEAQAKVRAEAEAAKAIQAAKDAQAAAEQRTRDAEAKLKADASDREQRAIDEAAAAELRAKQAEERAENARKNEAARIEAKRLAEEKAIQDAKEAREKDKAHRAEVDKRVIADLIESGVPASIASQVTSILARGWVKDVTINY